MVPVCFSSVIGGDPSPAPPRFSSSSVHPPPSHQILISSSAALQTQLGLWTFTRSSNLFKAAEELQQLHEITGGSLRPAAVNKAAETGCLGLARMLTLHGDLNIVLANACSPPACSHERGRNGKCELQKNHL